MTAIGAYAVDPTKCFPIPVDPKKGRVKFDIGGNETLCRVDQTYELEKSLKGRVTLPKRAELEDSRVLIKRSSDDIENHIDRRVAFFFQQLICCYDAPFYFEIGHTDAQGPSAPRLKLEVKAGGKQLPFNSAHSATIPLLYAYPRKEWEACEEGRGPKPKGFCYLKGSDYYRNSNSTVEMPKLINAADMVLDGTRDMENRLRHKAIALINRAAKGETSPENGLKLFLRKMSGVLRDVIKDQGTSVDSKRVLRRYLQLVGDIRGKKDLVDCLLTVNLSGESAALRKTLLKKRYGMILRSQEVQSIVSKKMATVKADMIVGRPPSNFDKVFKARLMEKGSPLDRQVMTKMFHLSMEQLQSQVEQACIKKPAQALVDKHPREIKRLLRDLRAECRGLDSEELTYRSEVLWTIRNSRGWSQQVMAANYQNIFPHSATSQSTICRLEREYKPIGQHISGELAEVFSVDRGLFLLSLFNSPS